MTKSVGIHAFPHLAPTFLDDDIENTMTLVVVDSLHEI